MSSSTVELIAPPGRSGLPEFEHGWNSGAGIEPYLSYVQDDRGANWSGDLEALHAESSRSHFLDVYTRRAILSQLGPLDRGSIVVDLGCSSGYLLEDLRGEHPGAVLVGIDLVGAGLRRAHAHVPEARLVQADARSLPLGESSVDAAVSANLLEHVPDDRRVLTELCRVLRPGAPAVVVVPAGSGLYDYYDRVLGHQRRYGRGQLASRAESAGLEVMDDFFLGGLLYPAFWLVKQRNRRRYEHLPSARLQARVAADIARTRSSHLGRLSCTLEGALLRRGVRPPIGIRELVVLRRARSIR